MNVEPKDILAIGTLILLEGLLSADNALILAVLVQPLKGRHRQKALLYGIFGAFALRFLGLLTATLFLKLWYMKLLGGGYLAYLATVHFARRGRKKAEPRAGPPRYANFWKIVATVELVDFAFAMDSILVAVGVSNKLWVVWTGGVLGIITMRIAAGLLVILLEKFASLEDMAYVLVGWVAVKMLLGAYEMFSEAILGRRFAAHLMPEWLFWVMMGGIVVAGTVYAIWRKGPPPEEADPGDSQIGDGPSTLR